MPWCEDCAKYWTPSAMNDDGTCPTCGRDVASSAPLTAKTVDVKKLAAGDAEDQAKAPWHFKLLMVMLAVYLGWRVVQLFL